MRSFLVLVVLGFRLASPAFANTNEIALGSSTRALRTSSANALTDDSLGGGTLGYAHALDMEFLPGLTLWAEAAFGWGGVDGTLFQTMSTEIDSLSVTVGGRARYPLRNRIIATARLDIGPARAALALRDDAGHSARATGWGATSQATISLDLHAVEHPRFSLGIRLELGYVAASPIELTTVPSSGSDGALQLEMSAASLGSLNLSGPVFAASLVSGF